ncbi:MAG: nuclear transport factor 2 family protein [Candidatus Sulfotelmatobacter sp.]
MRILLSLFLLLPITVAPAASVPDQLDATQTRILALENAWNQAEEHKDVNALDSLLDATLVYVDYDGSMMDKTQFMASIKVPSLHPEQIVNESMTAHVYGDSAVVTGIYREKGEKNGKPYLRRGRFTDTWVFHQGSWVCVASQSTLIMK